MRAFQIADHFVIFEEYNDNLTWFEAKYCDTKSGIEYHNYPELMPHGKAIPVAPVKPCIAKTTDIR